MRLLFISFPYPWPLNCGGQIRQFELIRGLASQHVVTLLTLSPRFADPRGEFPPSPLDEMCERVVSVDWRTLIPEDTRRRFHEFAPVRQRLGNLLWWPYSREAGPWMSGEVVELLRRVHAESKPDLVWVDRSFVAEAARAAGLSPIVVDVDDILTHCRWGQLCSSGWYKSKPLHYLEWMKLRRYEQRLARRFNTLVVCKEDDRMFFGRAADRVRVVPNGTKIVPACDPAAEQPGVVQFVGTLDYPPNIDAVQHFVAQVWPLVRADAPQAVFHAAGYSLEHILLSLDDGQTVYVHENVPTVDPYYDAASIVVSPVRIGSGTKLKVLEALVRGKALVATSHSATGLGLRPGIDFELADEPRQFAAACVRLINDPERRQQLGAAGRESVVRRFDWNAIGQRANDVVLEAYALCRGSSSACRPDLVAT
jgi:glycosyltransferase involved in cell wall biosynthesis